MARHAYLGDLEDVAHPHQAHYAHGAIVHLPLMFLQGIVLFPGEELPLRVLSETNLDTIRERLAGTASMLAVVCPGQGGTDVYGTTVRVERIGIAERSATLTGAAKQRFRLLSMRSSPGGRGAVGEIEIIADSSPPRTPFRIVPSAVGRRRRAQFPSYWGASEYQLFDAGHLVRRIQRIMLSSAHCNWFRKLTAHESDREIAVKHLMSASSDQDPVGFAFWIASNLPVSHSSRLDLFRTESIVQLLRREIAILETLEESIYCSHCGNFLAQTQDIFSMSSDGSAGTFVNPGGFVHQIMTLREVQLERLSVDPVRSTQDSWFPGYSWSVVECGMCHSHLGWQFDTTALAAASPTRFFGFRRTTLTQSWSAHSRHAQLNWSFLDEDGGNTQDEGSEDVEDDDYHDAEGNYSSEDSEQGSHRQSEGSSSSSDDELE